MNSCNMQGSHLQTSEDWGDGALGHFTAAPPISLGLWWHIGHALAKWKGSKWCIDSTSDIYKQEGYNATQANCLTVT
jgi:hypothetical protein